MASEPVMLPPSRPTLRTIAAPEVAPNRPAEFVPGRLMTRPEMTWPAPSKVPVNGVLVLAPTGTKVAPFHTSPVVPVLAALISCFSV